MFELGSFSLQQAWALLALPLPWLVYRFWPAAERDEAALRVPFFQTLAMATEGGHPHLQTGRRWLLPAIIWLLLIGAATDPNWLGEPAPLPASGRELMLAVDISGSMQIEDMQAGNEQVSRLIAVKAVVSDFIQRRQGDRLGLLLFGSQAYVQAPLTFDLATVKQFLQEAQLGFAGKETAIGDAIGLAIKRLRERPGNRHVLILLTDGANTAGRVSPLDAARLAAKNSLTIYTVGVGADEMILPGLFGSSFGARRVNPSADLDEKTLRQIADLTGGRYFRARDPRELAGIYAELDRLEPVAAPSQTVRPQQSLAHWPLALALLFSALWAAAHCARFGAGRAL